MLTRKLVDVRHRVLSPCRNCIYQMLEELQIRKIFNWQQNTACYMESVELVIRFMTVYSTSVQ